MATYILTKKQKELVVEALRDYKSRHYPNAMPKQQSAEAESIDILSAYIENPYSGSWMGKKNIR